LSTTSSSIDYNSPRRKTRLQFLAQHRYFTHSQPSIESEYDKSRLEFKKRFEKIAIYALEMERPEAWKAARDALKEFKRAQEKEAKAYQLKNEMTHSSNSNSKSADSPNHRKHRKNDFSAKSIIALWTHICHKKSSPRARDVLLLKVYKWFQLLE
jgi:hypothetical protein